MQIVLILLAFDWPLMMFFIFFIFNALRSAWSVPALSSHGRAHGTFRARRLPELVVSGRSSKAVRTNQRLPAVCARRSVWLCREPRAVKRRSYFRTRGYKALYGVFYTRVFYLYINHRCGLRTVFSTVHLNLEMLHNSPV